MTALVLLAAVQFADYPLERPMLALMIANPIDLARLVLLLHFDVAALLGYTGAVFERFVGGALGLVVAGARFSPGLQLPRSSVLGSFVARISNLINQGLQQCLIISYQRVSFFSLRSARARRREGAITGNDGKRTAKRERRGAHGEPDGARHYRGALQR